MPGQTPLVKKVPSRSSSADHPTAGVHFLERYSSLCLIFTMCSVLVFPEKHLTQHLPAFTASSHFSGGRGTCCMKEEISNFWHLMYSTLERELKI